MAKKSGLKASLLSQQARLKKNEKVHEASQRNQKQLSVGSVIRKATSSASNRESTGSCGRKPSTIPFQPTDTILLIGEGNFSFTRALLSHPTLQYLPAENVTATAYDSERECYDKYPESRRIVEELRNCGVGILFSVDATALEWCKALKGRRWDRVVWNFPHAGKGITDQDRNILSNQILLLGFLKSVAPFLITGPVPSIHIRRRKRKNTDDDVSDLEEDLEGSEDAISSTNDDMLEEAPMTRKRVGARGTVLITLRDVPPYTEWNLPKLAKSPPSSQTSLATPNPRYIQLRSFIFRREDWPGYEHRMTKGERAHGTGTTGKGGEDRTWEFCLRDLE